MNVETDLFAITVVENAFTARNGLSKRPAQWVGLREIHVACKSCSHEWGERAVTNLAGPMGHITIECPDCDAEEIIPLRLFAPGRQAST